MNNFSYDKIISKVFLFTLFLFAVSLLLPENLRNSVVILFALSLIGITIKSRSIEFLKNRKLIVNTSLFALLSISLFYTENMDYGLKRILALISLFVFPLAFASYTEKYNPISKEKVQKIYFIFYISTIVFFIGVFVQNYFNDHLNELIFKQYSERLNSKYGKYSLHPIYASMYIGISLLLSYKFYHNLSNKTKKFFVLLGNLFLVIIIIILARKGVVVVLSIIFTFLFIKNQKKKHLIYYILFFLSLLLVSYLISPIRSRYLELFNAILDNGNGQIGSTTYRLNIYKCSLNLISINPLIGYGIGDTKEALTICYIDNFEIFKGKYFNSHNQYISVWLSSGIVGFLSLLGMIIYNLKLLLNKKLIIESLIVILFITVMFIENILERQSGVILFSFFINFFAYIAINERKDF